MLFLLSSRVAAAPFCDHARGSAHQRTGERKPMVSEPRQDYRVTTAEIIYRLPDHPSLLQSFTWQKLDRSPDYPELRRFLAFWKKNLDGELHSVRVGQSGPLGRGRFRHIRHSQNLH
jgi:uncharacterized protein Usg